jgi:D-3-phosphoglycerate dehydrogenase
MYTVKTLNKIAKIGLDRLDKNYFVQDDCAENPDAIIVRSADMHNYEINPALLCVARAGAGYNNIPTDRFAEAGVVVFNTPGANANAVKELTLAALILASRDIIGGIKWLETIADKGEAVTSLVESGKSAFVGPEIAGKTLGLIGLGAVGAKVASCASALGMVVIAYDPFVSDEVKAELLGTCEIVNDEAELFKRADYISLHLPYNKDTKGKICSSTIAMMKDGVRIINIARGELVCDADIKAALESGKVARYVTDFPNCDVLNTKCVIAIPHLGASTPESEDNCAVMAAAQTAEYILKGNIVNSVNLPNISMDRAGTYRAVIIAKKSAEINVKAHAYTERTRGEYKVALIDFDEKPDAEKLAAIEGVIRVRVI